MRTLIALALLAAVAHADPLWGAVSRGSSVDKGAVLTLDDALGTAAFLGDPTAGNVGLTGLTFGAGGRLYGSTIAGFGTTSRLYEIDPATGGFIADIGDLAAPNIPNIPISVGDLAYDPTTGTLYASSSNADGTGNGGFIYSVNPATGVFTDVWGNLPNRVVGGIAFAPDGTLYATGFRTDFTPVVYRVDLTKPALGLTEVAVLPFYMDGLAVRPSDGLLFAVPGGPAASALFTIDPGTGVVTQVAAPFAGGWSVSDLAFAIPEPGSLLLALSGLFFVYRRKRRSIAA